MPILDAPSELEGDVRGPTGATDNAIARFDGTSGKLLQNSGVIIDDINGVTGMTSLVIDGTGTGDLLEVLRDGGASGYLQVSFDGNGPDLSGGPNYMGFSIGASEAMRIDSSGNLVMNQHDIKEVDQIDGGASVSDILHIAAHTAAMVDPDADGKVTFHNFLTFNGITDFTGTTDANFQVVSWDAIVDCSGQGIVIPQGFWWTPTIQYDTAQTFGGAAVFQDGSIWEETAALGAAHGVFSIGSFLGSIKYLVGHAGAGTPPSMVYGYDAGPRIDAGTGTLTVPEMVGYATNRPFALKTALGLQQLRNGAVCTLYTHLQVNSGNANALLLVGGSTITTEVGLDIIDLNQGATAISIRSNDANAYMEHAADIRIKTDSKGLVLGAGQDVRIQWDGTTTQITGSGYVRIGSGTTSHGLAADGDFLVSGVFECDGGFWLDLGGYINGAAGGSSYLWLSENDAIGFGVYADYSSDQLLFLTRAQTDNQIVITTFGNYTKNHDHADGTNPTLFVHSATDPDSDNTQWLSWTHNQTNAYGNVGSGGWHIDGGYVGLGIAPRTDTRLTLDKPTMSGSGTWHIIGANPANLGISETLTNTSTLYGNTMRWLWNGTMSAGTFFPTPYWSRLSLQSGDVYPQSYLSNIIVEGAATFSVSTGIGFNSNVTVNAANGTLSAFYHYYAIGTLSAGTWTTEVAYYIAAMGGTTKWAFYNNAAGANWFVGPGAEEIQFRNASNKISSDTLGYIDVTAAVRIDLNQNVLVTGNVNMTGDNTVQGGSQYVGVNDNTRGILYAYGPATGNPAGGTLVLYTGEDHDASIDFFQILPNTDDLEIRAVNTAKLTYKGGEDRWDFAARVDILNTTLNVGVEDTTYGSATLFGQATGSSQGGVLYLQTAADYDASINTYTVRAYNDDLEFNAGASSVKLTYEGGDDIWSFKTDVEIPSTDAYYLGDAATDGTWRFIRSGNDLVIERREAGAYVTKSTISA